MSVCSLKCRSLHPVTILLSLTGRTSSAMMAAAVVGIFLDQPITYLFFLWKAVLRALDFLILISASDTPPCSKLTLTFWQMPMEA